MDRKPWNNNGPHRASFGSDRRDGDRFSDRGPRRFERSDRREFGEKRDFGGKRDFGEKRDFGDRRGFGERRSFGDRRGFGGGRQRRFDGSFRREDFGVRSGPRARAAEARRFADRSEFAKNAVVRLDSDVADYFESAEAVNNALRMLISASRLVRRPEPAEPAVKPETAEAVFTDVDRVDDVEEENYGAGSEADDAGEAAETAEADEAAEKAEEAEESEAEDKKPE